MNIQLAVGALALVAGACAHAQTTPAKLSDAALEQAYWRCIELDSRATAAGDVMQEPQLSFCSSISKELQVRRFGDDFGKLHAWTTVMKERTRVAR